MIVKGCEFNVIDRPITPGSEPKARFHRPSLIRTTLVLPPGRSSSAVKLRPSAGVIRRVGRKVAVTFMPWITSASPLAGVSVKPAL